MLTIPMADWHPSELPDGVAYLKGQGEEGEGGYLHWQLLVVFEEQVSLRMCKSKFCNTAHCELTRSIAADAYVWKDDTYIDGTRFELGAKPIRRNSKPDSDSVWELARQGELLAIESSIRIQHYRTLRTIRADYSDPVAYERKVVVYHGPTGTGKSRRAWEEATWSAYPKDPPPNFGMDIEIRSTLCSTNFEEVSTSPIFLDGSIGIRYLWRSRELPPVW